MRKFIFILILNLILVSNTNAKNHNLNQINELSKLFSELGKINNIEDGDILEKKIWAVWNKHPNQNELTEKLEFGTELMYQGQYEYALKVFTNIIETDSEWSEAWNKRATLLFYMKDYQKSLKDISKVLDLEPRHFGALSGRAQIYLSLKEYEKAVDDLRKAKSIYPLIKSGENIKLIEKIIKDQQI